MTVAEWIMVKDNPIQRDTERHAAKAKHLLTPRQSHAVVHAAKLPSGQLIKIDGHTRALIWSRGIVQHPNKLRVLEYPVNSIEEAAELYKEFDSGDALETTQDKVSGAFNGMGYHPVSPLVSSGAISHALRLAWQTVYGYSYEQRPRDIYDVITAFATEILALDDLNLRRGQFPGGVIAAILISFRKHGDKILPFWRAVMANSGVKQNGRFDGVQAVNDVLLSRKTNAGHSAALDTLGRCLSACEKWLNNETMVIIPRPLDVGSYLNVQTARPKYKLVKRMKRAVPGNGANGATIAVE
jgi:hypothetical protein